MPCIWQPHVQDLRTNLSDLPPEGIGHQRLFDGDSGVVQRGQVLPRSRSRRITSTFDCTCMQEIGRFELGSTIVLVMEAPKDMRFRVVRGFVACVRVCASAGAGGRR